MRSPNGQRRSANCPGIALIGAVPAEEKRAHPISTRVNNLKNDKSEFIGPAER